MKKLKELMKKFCTREVILYLVFGVLTTIVNWLTFYLLTKFCHMDATEWQKNLANFIAIILAVLVAYFTNKGMVFHSEAKTLKEKWTEFCKFILGRAFTMVLEFGLDAILFLTVIPEMVTKAVVTIIVIILNFFISKYFSFKKK